MTIRFANNADTIHVVRSLQNKGMDYNTPAQAKNDITCGRLLVVEENGKLLGSCALVKKPHRGYTAITRVCVYSKKSCGKGIAQMMVNYVCSLGLGALGATPWNDNPAMCHVFEKAGFVYQYTFKKNYEFFLKNA